MKGYSSSWETGCISIFNISGVGGSVIKKNSGQRKPEKETAEKHYAIYYYQVV